MKKYILLTGASSGIGLELLKILLQKDFFLVLPIRNLNRKKDFLNLVSPYKDKIVLMDLDLTHLEKYYQWETISVPKLDILIFNAGVYTHTKEMKSRLELQWLINFISPVMITKYCWNNLQRSDFPQILYVSSRIHYYVDLNFFLNKHFEYSHYNGKIAYANSKFAITAFAMYLADQFPNIKINVVHPGVYSTGITRDLPVPIRILWNLFIGNPKEGGNVLYTLLFDPYYNSLTKTYFDILIPKEAHKGCYDRNIQSILLNYLKENFSFEI